MNDSSSLGQPGQGRGARPRTTGRSSLQGVLIAALFLGAFAGPALAQGTTSAEDIHDIRGPISIPYEWLWAAYILAGVIAAALIYALVRFLQSRAKVRAKLPFEIALEKLEAARTLMKPETVREYAFTVSEIIRVYIEQRFGEKAAHHTTEEFLSDLLRQTGTPLAEHRARLEDFLNHCDLIKFARWGASVGELEAMHESARVFIVDTRPQAEAGKGGNEALAVRQTTAAAPPTAPSRGPATATAEDTTTAVTTEAT